jgi:hypothetical protein
LKARVEGDVAGAASEVGRAAGVGVAGTAARAAGGAAAAGAAGVDVTGWEGVDGGLDVDDVAAADG